MKNETGELRLIAFHGQQAIKDKYVARVRMHRAADNLIRGTGWDGHRGCAVGCTLEKYEHTAYEAELGIPRSLAHIEDELFERLPLSRAMEWPEKFLISIVPGADLSMVIARFLHWLLVDPEYGVIRFSKSEKTKKSIQDVADLYAKKIAGESIEVADWEKVRVDAEAAASAADSAADAEAAAVYSAEAAAVYSAEAAAVYSADAAAAYAADSAAVYSAEAAAVYSAEAAAVYSAEAAAAYAADSAAAYAADSAAAYAADSAAVYSADSAAAYAAEAAYAAREKARIRQSEKLLDLLASAPMMEAVDAN